MSDLLDQHVGRWWNRINLRVTNLDVIGDSAEDIERRTAAVVAEIEAAIARYFPDHEQRLPQPIADAYGPPKLIRTRAERNAESDALLSSIGEGMREADERRKAEMASHPNNGTAGFWQVVGIRHDAIVQASSAPEAIALAADQVHEWESPEAHFIGTELPKVF